MSDYDKIYDEHLDTELSDSSFVYKHPISGELHEGIGDPPLMWGDYPQGIVENTEEAYIGLELGTHSYPEDCCENAMNDILDRLGGDDS